MGSYQENEMKRGWGGGEGMQKQKTKKKKKKEKQWVRVHGVFFFKKKGTKEEKGKAKKWARVLRKRGEGAELRRIGRKGKQLE